MNAHIHRLRTGLRTGVISLAFIVMPCILSPAAESPAPAVNRGDTIAEVVAKLGRPRGSIERKNTVTYTYDRGMVNFIDGRVVHSFLVTPEEAQQRRLDQERAAEASRKQAELQRQRLLAEGQAELSKHNSDTTFDKHPAPERLAYWEDFQRRYPYTDVSANLAAARAAITSESDLQVKEDELKTVSARIEAIKVRRTELDTAYATSLANWKRNEIDAERTKLSSELEDCLRRIVELQGGVSDTSTNSAATPTTGR